MLNIGQDNIGRDSSYFQSTETDCFYVVKPARGSAPPDSR